MVQLIARSGDRRTAIEDYRGIGFKSPVLAFSLSLFMLSLLGMPLTAGFMGKIMVFRSAIDQSYYGLVIVGVLNTAISAYYYLRLIIVMFFGERTMEWSAPRIPVSVAVALAITVLGVLYLGMFPGRVINALQTRIDSQLFTNPSDESSVTRSARKRSSNNSVRRGCRESIASAYSSSAHVRITSTPPKAPHACHNSAHTARSGAKGRTQAPTVSRSRHRQIPFRVRPDRLPGCSSSVRYN